MSQRNEMSERMKISKMRQMSLIAMCFRLVIWAKWVRLVKWAKWVRLGRLAKWVRWVRLAKWLRRLIWGSWAEWGRLPNWVKWGRLSKWVRSVRSSSWQRMCSFVSLEKSATWVKSSNHQIFSIWISVNFFATYLPHLQRGAGHWPLAAKNHKIISIVAKLPFRS